MRRRTVILTLLLTCLAPATPARPEILAAETEILRRVAETYRTLGRYLFEAVIRVEIRGGRSPQSHEASFTTAVGGDGRVREEVHDPVMGGMLVSDGRQVTMYNGALRQYMRRQGNADSVLARHPGGGLGATLTGRYAAIAEQARSARRLGDETVSLEGAQRDCYVLEVSYPRHGLGAPVSDQSRTYWIDKQTHLVLRQRSLVCNEPPLAESRVEQEETILFKRARIDPALPDSLWVFRPPAGAREVAEFTPGPPDPGTEFTGKPAIDFTLKDLEGRRHNLKSLRGKTVLLDFWASWCGPCRITMPQVAKIHEQYRNRGVEVVSINVGETADRAGAYMKRNGYRFTTLLDEDRSVATQYRVNGIPTLVVIDRQGTVSDYLVGARDEAALRAALKKAGVE